ncbi:MAG: phosphoribosylaminoimidazolecarboxamide formyltransferase, partial [Oscillospiraceae bacterium]|nr:phosphoribosylaminoimidazolecarboxamide formyltransferase [Oscillospiraceae bacterium]
ALKILKTKKRGNYNIIKIDKSYRPNDVESKDVFGITFEQKRNDLKVTDNLFENVVTKNKIIPKAALIDLIISMITLKYTQSNSVCYVKDGMAIGIGAGQQSRIHCTRLAGNKADIFWLRQHIKVMSLPFLNNITRAQRDNAIDIYISNDYEDILADGCWQQLFSKKPEPLTNQEKKQWILKQQNISLGSDAFFPFGDNIERAHRSGVKYICQPGGSIRDDDVIKTCDKYEIAMAFTKARLFHH